MKKFLLMFAAAAMLISCGGKEGNATNGEAGQEAKGYEFSVQNNITGTTGTKNCHLPELGAPIKFEVAGEGDILDVTATVSTTHTDKTEVEEPRATTELWISGRDEDNKDVKVTLTATEESQAALVEWIKKPAGEKIDLVFKGRVPKADLDKLNAKECTNTLVL